MHVGNKQCTGDWMVVEVEVEVKVVVVLGERDSPRRGSTQSRLVWLSSLSSFDPTAPARQQPHEATSVR